MSTVTETPVALNSIVLLRVPYRLYVRLRDEPANLHLKMTYFNGTLEIMSPQLYEHERYSGLLGMFVRAVVAELRIPCRGSGSTTFRRGGETIYKGSGKEPDRSYYIPNAAVLVGKKTIDLEAGDSPPDLWVEVDHRASSVKRFPIYAALGVPEVWRYRTRGNTLGFYERIDGEKYRPIERSLALPMLTPGLVLQGLAMSENLDESEWDLRLRAWVRETFVPGAAERPLS